MPAVDLQQHFSKAGDALGAHSVTARYRAYAELRHSWSRSGGGLEFWISDYLKGAPDDVLDSLAWYLLCKAMRRPCAPDRSRVYLDHAYSEKLWMPHRELYLSRARNLSFEDGEVRHLREVFDYVNSYYFSSAVQDPKLAWSRESPRTRLGFYFGPLNLLALNKVLDSDKVPRYVPEFVMYHELLHHIDGCGSSGRTRVHHTKAFREKERAFAHFEDAERWLRRLARMSRSR